MPDRHWLAEQGFLNHRLYTFLGGMSQDHWEYSIAHYILSKFIQPPRYILEIGVYAGYTMVGWLNVCNERSAWKTAVGVDVNLRANAPLPPNVRLIEADSHSPATLEHVKSLFPNGVDLLFIDGDHSLEGCLMDYNYYAPLVNVGGVVAFHDIWIGDVRATWREVVRRYPTVQIQNQAADGSRMGIGIAFRLPQCGPFQQLKVDDV